MRTPEEILSQGRIIYEGEHEFIPKKFAVEAVEAARLEVAEFFVSLCGKFGHYEFFTKELWRKVKGFKDKDEGEVKCAFLSVWTKNELDIITYQVGSSWSCHCGSESFFNDYVEEWKPVFEDFAKWVESQR